MHLVVGLGNPGPEYQENRHNLGFKVVDELLARARRLPPGMAPRAKFGAEIGEVTIAGERVLLCKPMEFMNVSGQAVARVAGFWKVPVGELIVVHDELDLPFGRLKLGTGGGHGGHNGIRSLLADLGDAGFARVRVGVGRPTPGHDPANYLLSNFSRAEAKELPDLIGTAADAIEAIVNGGLTAAMNKFNGKGQDSQKDNQKDDKKDGGRA
ncbi:MAG TPA: aminoacyl-tRNA hydrolase [Polyangia bacterium]|jgi:PTH1 family peptidyl-tRNA hydrolase|nr:aminoacyl-tRNA hydrolase [Polyangia bacterium]